MFPKKIWTPKFTMNPLKKWVVIVPLRRVLCNNTMLSSFSKAFLRKKIEFIEEARSSS